ncbi:CHAD domain-containing protein [Rhodoplanes azumiensis]|uniref:CHAD domain-containing protein n=1 Tax=Rhodoplanes azumiensis TaxID=1897628 RepID=A0ABW5AID3_9BRAD
MARMPTGTDLKDPSSGGLHVPDMLREIARGALTEARTAITDPNLPEAEAIHDFRKSMKRWRAHLRLVEPFLGDEGKRLRTEARDLARLLAGARDAQTARDALEDLGKLDDSARETLPVLSDRSLATVTARLDAVRTQAEGVSLTPDTRREIDEILFAATEGVKYWPIGHLTFRDVATELAGHYGRARKAIPDDWQTSHPETLHEMRQKVVIHRYQMEIVAPLWPRFGEFWIGESQRLRDRLGHHQDLIILAGFTEPHGPLAPWRSRLVPLIAARRAEHVAVAARLAGRLFADSPRSFRRRLLALWEHRVPQ